MVKMPVLLMPACGRQGLSLWS